MTPAARIPFVFITDSNADLLFIDFPPHTVPAIYCWRSIAIILYYTYTYAYLTRLSQITQIPYPDILIRMFSISKWKFVFYNKYINFVFVLSCIEKREIVLICHIPLATHLLAIINQI